MTESRPTNLHNPPGTAAAPKFEADRYRHLIEEFELTEQQETELLQTLWNIMVSLVDIGFGVSSVQRFLPDLFENAGREPGGLIRARKSRTGESDQKEDLK